MSLFGHLSNDDSMLAVQRMIGAALASVGVVIFARRVFVAFFSAVALLVVVLVIALLGIQSSARLADVRAHNGRLLTANVSLEARDIAADWAKIMFIIGVGLAAAAVSHRQRSRANRS